MPPKTTDITAQHGLAQRLRDARTNSGLKAIDIARRLSVSRQLVSHWEHARCDVPADKLADLADLLDVDLVWLLTGRTNRPKPSRKRENDMGLSALGRPSRIPKDPSEATLERVANPHPNTTYVARFTAPEFTSLCPVTGQPDFAHIVIDYVPGDWILESKSFKLYLAAYRNHAAFHEACTLQIAKQLVETLQPNYLRIGGYWYPRGGIPIDIFWQTGKPPKDAWLPDPGVSPYRGRG